MAVGSAFAAQAGRNLAIDVDERIELGRFGASEQLVGLTHDENPQIGDVLADGVGEGAVVLGHGLNEDGPDLAVLVQRFLELIVMLGPGVANILQAGSEAGKQVGLKISGTRRLLCGPLICECPLMLHLPATPLRIR